MDDDEQKYPSQLAERFQVRLPIGLRDRIKAYAERHGRSMNTEIVRVLEREFPAPWPIEHKIADIMSLVDVIKTETTDQRIDSLADELFKTIEGIANGRVKGLSPEARENVHERFTQWVQERSESGYYDYEATLDQGERERLEKTGDTAKYVDPFEDEK